MLKLGNLNQNAKRYEARNTEREARRPLGRAPFAREARDKNVRAKRADFCLNFRILLICYFFRICT